MQNGTYACRFNMLGYRKDKDETEPRIIPEEAEIVRAVFKMYDEGYSLDQIKSYLEEKGVKTSNGKTQWCKENIRRMLTNEKYVGDVIYQKTFRTDCINNTIRIQYFFEETAPLSALLPSAHNTSVFFGQASRR